jgi:hypothetical protein
MRLIDGCCMYLCIRKSVLTQSASFLQVSGKTAQQLKAGGHNVAQFIQASI